ncbi:uncharacterized protein MYCFIDRAFT_206899 [Pseudocercospora fijiensis CIRAD86]|uniref:Uncharacterized protein n=1 Tax=Pseudocercospora fijiensis (strain CIRAD86) TaxID=383855 RepID=M3BBS8_PSEFD|nr:uncharacterized protein MYCFIDRAFT_206899 [Pseudocercospora fijiensis CIRAD86]EME86658.1 hypothetical protein MYCFIDRAFT_206899 [Pseudocercospora fijiensis CIRAD86]
MLQAITAMPGNPLYKFTRKFGRNWDAETRHLIHPRDDNFCCITSDHPSNQPVLPGSVADFTDCSPEQAYFHHPTRSLNNHTTQRPVSVHHEPKKTTNTAENRSRTEKSKSASYTDASSDQSRKARSRSADSKVKAWLKDVSLSRRETLI